MAEGGQELRGGNGDTVGIKALSVLYPFLLILSVAVVRIEKTAFFLKFHTLTFPFTYCSAFSHRLSHRCHKWKELDSELYFLFACMLPPSHPVWPSRFVSGHLLRGAQGDTWFLRHRWVTASLGLLMTTSCPPRFSPSMTELGSLSSWYKRPPWAFCCFCATLIYGSAVRATGAAGWLTSSSLTQSFTACVGNAVRVCVPVCVSVQSEQRLLDGPPDIFLQGQQRLGQASIMEK